LKSCPLALGELEALLFCDWQEKQEINTNKVESNLII
jgi:hypothetical protein